MSPSHPMAVALRGQVERARQEATARRYRPTAPTWRKLQDAFSAALASGSRPEHVSELEPTALPAGFRAAGVAAGLKPAGLDVGMLVADVEETASAARFTTNSRVGAPVSVSREAALDRLRVVLANSGGSNTGDGERGLETARASQTLAAELLGTEPERVGLASTGLIATELPREPLLSGVRACVESLAEDSIGLSEAILTTDRGPKRACLSVSLPSGTVRLAAQAKGAGMISPRAR